MAYSDMQWERAKGYYEAGQTLSVIKKKTGIARNTVSQRAKREQWKHGEHTDYIEAKELIARKKGTKNEHLINILDEVSEERTKHLLFFNNSALKNQQLANKAIESIKNKENIDAKDLYPLGTHSQITQRNKETVLGKQPDTVINNSNNQVTSIEVTFVDE